MYISELFGGRGQKNFNLFKNLVKWGMGSGTELTERKIRSILTILVLGCYEKEEAATKRVARWNGIIWMKKADGQDD